MAWIFQGMWRRRKNIVITFWDTYLGPKMGGGWGKFLYKVHKYDIPSRSKFIKGTVLPYTPQHSSRGLQLVAHKLNLGMLLFPLHRVPRAMTVQNGVGAVSFNWHMHISVHHSPQMTPMLVLLSLHELPLWLLVKSLPSLYARTFSTYQIGRGVLITFSRCSAYCLPPFIIR